MSFVLPLNCFPATFADSLQAYLAGLKFVQAIGRPQRQRKAHTAAPNFLPLAHFLLHGSAKAAESAFLGLYKRLYEAPDPAPALAAGLEAASRAAQLEAESAKMGQVRPG